LALSRRRAREIGPIDPFGFSWSPAVSLQKPPIMWVGLSWISLDSLVRIETFQWVTWHKARKFFPRALCPMGRRAGTAARGRGHAEAQDCPWGKLNLITDFLQ
jgi:hypothetical protein